LNKAIERDETGRGGLREIFGEYFPEWQRELSEPCWEFRDGPYVFKASLGNVWRRIRIPANSTLDELAWSIMNSFEFDGYHSYMFLIRDLDGATIAVRRPEANPEIATHEVQIGMLPIAVGDSMPFIYDSGAGWRFSVKLEQIDPPEEELKYAEIIAQHGTPPCEYGDEEW
jgi:hypothetical protein